MPAASPEDSNPAVRRVYYPGFGGVVSAEIDGDAVRFVSNLRLFRLAESLGGVRSLVCHPATMTHAAIPPDERARLGLKDSLVRLSVGIEDADDLVEDFRQAFA